MDNEKPYTVHSETKITLSQDAKFWAKEHGLSLNEMAQYLLNREKLRENGEDYGA
jgi:hypothetical protein